MGSTRLPGKVLQPIAQGRSMIDLILERLRHCARLSDVVVAIPDANTGGPLGAELARLGANVFAGSEDDVLDRYYQAARRYKAEHVVRITADCPLVSIRQTDRLIQHHLRSGADYSHNITVWGSGMPLGTGSEVFTFEALETSWRDGKLPHHREHVDEYVGDHRELFKFEMLSAPEGLCYPDLRLTVDTVEDLELIRAIYDRLYKLGQPVGLVDVVALMADEPALREINRHVVQKPL